MAAIWTRHIPFFYVNLSRIFSHQYVKWAVNKAFPWVKAYLKQDMMKIFQKLIIEHLRMLEG